MTYDGGALAGWATETCSYCVSGDWLKAIFWSDAASLAGGDWGTDSSSWSVDLSLSRGYGMEIFCDAGYAPSGEAGRENALGWFPQGWQTESFFLSEG